MAKYTFEFKMKVVTDAKVTSNFPYRRTFHLDQG